MAQLRAAVAGDDVDSDSAVEEEGEGEIVDESELMEALPELPFAVDGDFLDSVREYLVDKEDMDQDDEISMQAAVTKMAADLCEAAMAEEDPQLDQDIWTRAEAAAAPFAEEAARRGAAASGQASGAGAGSSGEEEFTGLVDVPEGVSPTALEELLGWEAEGTVERSGPRGHMGWNADRGGLHPAAATAVMGIDNWRVGARACPAAAEFAANLESFWRQMFPEDLAAAAMDARWKLLDSVSPNEPGLAWGSSDPRPGERGYPRLVIENRAYQTRTFRSLHLELAIRQDGLNVVHCVMWPRRRYGLPILGLDAVFNKGSLTFFIADASPVGRGRDGGGPGPLPPVLSDAVRMLRAQFVGEGLPPESLPDWTKLIFSDDVVAVRPRLQVEADMCMMYGVALARAYLLYAKRCEPLPEEAVERLADIDAGHRRYCEVQRGNAKTTAVLRKAFSGLGAAGDELVKRYMHEVLFDHEFHYDYSGEMKAWMREQNAGLGVAAPSEGAKGAARDVARVVSSAMKRGADNGEVASQDSANQEGKG